MLLKLLQAKAVLVRVSELNSLVELEYTFANASLYHRSPGLDVHELYKCYLQCANWHINGTLLRRL